jgi:hypothetical protein
MALLKDYDFANGFAAVRQLQAAGQTPSGSAAPKGISDRIAVEKAPDGRSSFVARISSSDSETALGIRSELAFDLEPLSERWYVWGTYLPKTWPTNLFSIFQIHDTPDGGDNPRYPNFIVLTEKNWLRIEVPKRILPTETIDNIIVGTYRLPVGRWFDQCLHVKWATDGTGFLEYMVDGFVLYREWLTANQYVDVVGPYAKIGVYDAFHSGAFPDATAYFDRLRVYDSGESYVSVLGGPPAPRKSNQI